MAEHAELCVVLRDESGAVTPNTVVSVWSDAGATTLATLYTTRTGTLTYANPLSSDADGILHCFVDDPRLWYTTATQTTPLPLPVQEYSTVVNVRDFGALGDNTADDTAAFVAAVAYVDALEGVWPLYEKPTIYVPAGTYRLSNVPIANKNVRFRGDGANSSILYATDLDGILFDLGTFDPTPSGWYGGPQGFGLEGIAIREPLHDYGGAPGRYATAIRDCGGGNVRLKDVAIRGFKYGFVAAYGSDLDVLEDCDIKYCDLGVEVGPHCNQWEMSRTIISGCGVGVLYEWPCGGTQQECWYVDQHEFDIKFDFTSPTVAGVTHADSYYWSSTVLDHCSFESAAGMYGTDAYADPAGHIFIGGDTSTPKDITIRDARIFSFTNTTNNMMAAEDPGTVYAFVRLEKGQEIRILGAQYVGHRLDALVAPLDGYTSGRVYVSDLVIEPGDTLVPFSPWPTSGCLYDNPTPTIANQYGGLIGWNGEYFRTRYDAGEHCIALAHSTDNVTFTETLKFYPLSGKVALSGDLGVNYSTFGVTPDPTGSYGRRGDVKFNSAPVAGGIVGWMCVTTGSPGVWKSFGTLES